MVPEVHFDQVAPGKYEDTMSVLLARLRQARRVDSSGGDEGRDCYFTDESTCPQSHLIGLTGGYCWKSETKRLPPPKSKPMFTMAPPATCQASHDAEGCRRAVGSAVALARPCPYCWSA